MSGSQIGASVRNIPRWVVPQDPFHEVLRSPQPLHTRADHSFLSPGGAGLFQPLSQRPGISEAADRPVDPQYPLCATEQWTGGERGEAEASCLCFRLVLRQDPLSVTTNHPNTQWLHSYSVHISAGQLAIVVLARPSHRSVRACRQRTPVLQHTSPDTFSWRWKQVVIGNKPPLGHNG